MDGDGAPELVLVMNLSRFGDNATPHVFVATYSWDGAYFSELPLATLDVGKENRSLRCNNFQLLDQDADGDQELVLALGSPFRGFAIVNASSSGLSLTKKVRPDELLVGSGLLYVGVVDYDSDGYEDVIAIIPEGNVVKAQSFYNIGGVFDSGHLVKKEIVGLSKIPRIVDVFSKRLQVQERLTDEIKDCIQDTLSPKGVAVVIEAQHLCMQMRGVEKQHSYTTTSAFSGIFMDDNKTRTEFINLIK